MSTTTSPTLTANVEGHSNLVETVVALMEQSATEKQAWAVALRDSGHTNQQVGDAFEDLFGTPTKSGGAGNLVTAGLRAIGRDGEIKATGTGVRKTTVRGPEQLISDELDRARAALESVTKPVVEVQAVLDALHTDEGREAHIAARTAKLDEQVKALQAEAKALKADPSAFIDSEVQRLTERMDAARNAAGENEERMTQAIAGLEATLAIIAG